MTRPDITLVPLGGAPGLPLLVVGPSLGTSTAALWGDCAALLADRLHVVGWELPGHGEGKAVNDRFTIAELAQGVLSAVDGATSAPRFAYAGDSVGGAVGLQLALDAGERLTTVVALCTGAAIGTAESWSDRAALVRREGTAAVVDSSRERWFGPGFVDRSPAVAATLLRSLADADAESYALVCEALASFDVWERMDEIETPLLAVAGADDVATPPEQLRSAAAAVRRSRFVELDEVAHLAPAEAPQRVAELIGEQVLPDG